MLLIQKIFPGLQIYKWSQTYYDCETKDFVERKVSYSRRVVAMHITFIGKR